MTRDFWPSSEQPPAPSRLPRVEDLPLAENGYDRDRVREAFDAFYRHVAQLDSTLRALEAVDAFSRQASELRADLRALRSSGFGTQSWSPQYTSTRSQLRDGISPAVMRLTAEAAFLVAVPVLARFAELRPLYIVGLAALAWVIVVLFEMLAYRARFAPPRALAKPVAAEPEAQEEQPGRDGWGRTEAPAVEEMTVIEPPALGATAAERESEPESENELEPDAERKRWGIFRARVVAIVEETPAVEELPEPTPLAEAVSPEAEEKPAVEASESELVEAAEPEPIEPEESRPAPEEEPVPAVYEAEVARAAEPEPDPEPDPEPEPELTAVQTAAAEAAEPALEVSRKRRGFWRRHREPEQLEGIEELEEPEPVAAMVDSTPVDDVVGTAPQPALDPWETGPEFLADLVADVHTAAAAFTAEDEQIAEEPLTAERASLAQSGNGAEAVAPADGEEKPRTAGHRSGTFRYPLRRGRRR